MSHLFNRILCVIAGPVLLNACSNNDSEQRPNVQRGLSVYVQANIEENTQTATLGAGLYHDGQKVALVGGDMIRAKQGNNNTWLTTSNKSSQFLSSRLANVDTTLPITFSVEYDPQVARQDRPYPSDEVFVDAGEGEYAGLEWSLEFPPTVKVSAPVSGTVYNYANDSIIIDWDAGVDKGQTIRVYAYLNCMNERVQLYKGADTGQWISTIDHIFQQSKAIDPTADAESDFERLFLNILELSFLGLIDFDQILNPVVIDKCLISLSVISEAKVDIGQPFNDGSVLASQSDSTVVRFEPIGQYYP